MSWIQNFDQNLLDLFTRCWGTRLDSLVMDVTALGGTAVLVLVTLFSGGLLFALGRYRTAVFVMLVIASGEVLVYGLKQTVKRDRPAAVRMHPKLSYAPTSASFPSGHSMSAAVTYLTLALVATTPLTGRRGRRYVLASALFLVALIGVSRVYLNVHYPTDVLGGWTFGLLWALACRRIEDRWGPLRREEAPAGAQ